MKFWQGKFNEALDENIKQFISTFSYDKRLYKHDIMGSIAHCTMLNEQGIISEKETKQLRNTLTQIFYDITSGTLLLENARDIFDFLDEVLVMRLGNIANKLNIARSKCDRAALTLRMYVSELCGELNESLKSFIESVMEVSGQNLTTVIPGNYRFAKGQPTTLAHTLMAFAEMFSRDIVRYNDIKKHTLVMPLYSMYGTGTRFAINRRRVAELLQFTSVTQNSLDALTDTDYVSEFISATAITAKHISTVCNTFIKWSSKDCGFVQTNDSITFDSGVTPTASEPVVLETIKAKLARCIAMPALLTELNENSLDYCGSVHEIAVTVLETETPVKSALEMLCAILPSFAFDNQAMLKAATADYSTARDCVDYLIIKGATESEAFETVGKLCEYCYENSKRLDTITLDVYKQFSPKFEQDVISAMRIKNATRLRKHEGEPGDVAVRAEIRAMGRKLHKLFPENK